MKKIEISSEEILDLMRQSFQAGLTSYADLSQEKCMEILNSFILNKSSTTKTTDDFILQMKTTYNTSELFVNDNNNTIQSLYQNFCNVFQS